MWCCRFPIYICGNKFLIWLRYWSCFRHSDKSGGGFLYIQFYKMLWLWFYVDFYLTLGFYYNAVEYRHKYLNTRRAPVSNVGIESVSSAGQAGFTYQAFVGRVT